MGGNGMVSLTEAASGLGVAAEQVRRYVRRGLLPATKIANAPDNWRVLRAHSAAVDKPHRTLAAGSLCAPAAAVALDLCASRNPREQRVADAIIEEPAVSGSDILAGDSQVIARLLGQDCRLATGSHHSLPHRVQ